MAMQRIWQIVSFALPLAISNWFFANLAHPLLMGLKQLTLRRAVYIAAFLVLLWGFAFLFSADIAIIFAGDTALYFEIASFIYFAIARTHIHRRAEPVIRALRARLQLSAQTIIRAMARARRLPRLPRLFDKSDSDDVPGGAFALA